jgi:hypothetical protein
MAKCARAAVNVNFFVRDTMILHCCHRHCGECLVHFEQINITRRPAGFVINFLDGTYRRRREPTRLL